VRSIDVPQPEYTHAWFRSGQNDQLGQPWRQTGFSSSEAQAWRDMEEATRWAHFAVGAKIEFSEVIPVERVRGADSERRQPSL
jgi:hypothetical protein